MIANQYPVSLLLILLASIVVICRGNTEHVELKAGAVTSQYTTPCNQYKYFKINVTNPCSNVRVLVSNNVSDLSDIVVMIFDTATTRIDHNHLLHVTNDHNDRPILLQHYM